MLLRIWTGTDEAVEASTVDANEVLRGMFFGDQFGFFRISVDRDGCGHEIDQTPGHTDECEMIEGLMVGDRLYGGGGAAPLFVVERVS